MKNDLSEQVEYNLKENKEKEKRAAELIIANEELAHQIKEKDIRTTGLIRELIIANRELASQIEDKEDRSAELVVANRELAFQTEEKADRAAELVVANRELAFQTEEKADRAAETETVRIKLALQSEEIIYLSYRDQLTGLYNRKFFEEELERLDATNDLPYTIVMGDINGLKMINDSFGYALGDELLKKTAEVIQTGCRAEYTIARLSGDEFAILMPKTTGLEAAKVIKQIDTLAAAGKKGSLDISISFGYETKVSEDQKSIDIYKKAEDFMYEHKTYERSSTRSKIIDLIMNTLYEKSNRELMHSKRVGELCGQIAAKMNFEKDDVNQIRTAGLMHDIGKIGIDENILNKPGKLTDDEWTEMKKHPEIGHRILCSDIKFSKIAGYIFEHHEYINGQGYPRGLKGEEIAVQSRIISIADAYDAMTSKRTYSKVISEDDAITEIKKCSGTQFDPEIARVFIEKVLKKESSEI